MSRISVPALLIQLKQQQLSPFPDYVIMAADFYTDELVMPPQKCFNRLQSLSRAAIKTNGPVQLKGKKNGGRNRIETHHHRCRIYFHGTVFLRSFFSFSLQPNDFNFFYFQLLIFSPPSFYFCSFFFAASANIDSSLNVIRN